MNRPGLRTHSPAVHDCSETIRIGMGQSTEMTSFGMLDFTDPVKPNMP